MSDLAPAQPNWWSVPWSIIAFVGLALGPVALIYCLDEYTNVPSLIVFFVVVFALAAVMTALEFRFGRRSTSGVINHADVASAFFGIFLTGGIGNGIVIVLLAPVGESVAQALGTDLWPTSWPLIIQVIVGLALADLVMYPIHRYMHKHDSLWRVHVVHHSVKELRPMRTFLQHPIEVLLLGVVPAIPFTLLGAPAMTAILVGAIRVTVGIVDHSSLPLRTSWLDYVIHTPNDHWWHHNLADWGGTNFTTVVIPIDIAFGTFRKPPDIDPVPAQVGIAEPDIAQNSYAQQFAVPFHWKSVRRSGHS